MSFATRIQSALKACFVHFLASLAVAASAAMLVFVVWYPHPYGLLSGGLSLFIILVCVDVVCGPLLTLILYNPKKSHREIFIDLSLVVIIQVSALIYGIFIVHQARPLFLVHEVDRFRVVAMPDFNGVDVKDQLASLAPHMRPFWRIGPSVVGIRQPIDTKERRDVMLESAFGGRDYAQRPDFYIPYDGAYKDKVLQRARPLRAFTENYPNTIDAAHKILKKHSITLESALFLPVMHKQEWVAVLDKSAQIIGFLPGDGFSIR